MNAKSRRCAVTTVVTEEEKRLFAVTARSLDIPCGALIRRLIRYFLDGRISWFNLFRQSSYLLELNALDDTCNKVMRTLLEPGECSAFVKSVDEWGSTTAVVIRRLVLLYITGRIERKEIWY